VPGYFSLIRLYSPHHHKDQEPPAGMKRMAMAQGSEKIKAQSSKFCSSHSYLNLWAASKRVSSLLATFKLISPIEQKAGFFKKYIV
jgi:hypothetical protein